MWTNHCRIVPVFLIALLCTSRLTAQIPKPKDAPKPLSPQESAARVTLRPGFRLDLVAAEPLVREPSGVCFDEQGRLFVCELHGYNLEGQYDIEELNKTGKLDRVVRRIQANPQAKKAAEKEQYGTVRRLIDSDGDGQMDKSVVWADRLPPCLGIIAARGGVIVICAPDIIFLADRDGDDRAEVRETLYTGFTAALLERRMNCPRWGLDDWIYVGRGQGGTITGPKLSGTVSLPSTDLRFKSDGSAIEPISGGTYTIGHAFTDEGDRFVVSTGSPAIYIAPLPWRYLARNPNVAAPNLRYGASSDQRVYPTSRPHPWRSKRANDPGFAKYYTDRYSLRETAPNGYFTSACGPLVYRDTALPGLHGQLLACEPAQNLLHRGVIRREGLLLKIRRPEGEEKREFLASSDPWFHPIALSHAPDGSVMIVDFYREIIEDYSAIPRYLQQQYGFLGGQKHGRIWRLTHDDAPKASIADMSRLEDGQLAGELANPRYWRRRTAQRLLGERKAQGAAEAIKKIAVDYKDPAAVIGALYTLSVIGELSPADITRALANEQPSVRLHALRLSEAWLDRDPAVLRKVLSMADDSQPTVLLQLALTLGESGDSSVMPVLSQLVREHGEVQFMTSAILSSLSGRSSRMLQEMTAGSQSETTASLEFIKPLCMSIAAGRDPGEISDALVLAGAIKNRPLQIACLRGLLGSFRAPVAVGLTDQGRAALKQLVAHANVDVRTLAQMLTIGMKVEEPAVRAARLAKAIVHLSDFQLPVATRLAAVSQLAAEEDDGVTAALLDSFIDSTPRVRLAILDAVFSRRSRMGAVVEAIAAKKLPASALTAVQRNSLLNHPVKQLRTRAARLFAPSRAIPAETLLRFTAALAKPRNLVNGEKIFRAKCGTCHQAHGIGLAVGPDLTAESRRAEETILNDVLSPNASISAGYATYTIETTDGQVVTGLLVVESPGSITLRAAEGKQVTVLRKDVETLKSHNISLMPEDLVKELQPKDLSDVIAWLRRPPKERILFDEDPRFVEMLSQGGGTASIVTDDSNSGLSSLRITPLQKHSPRIAGWNFQIREKPGPGEFRYLRFSWKSAGAKGILIELANDGNWPKADAPRFRYVAGSNTTGWQATRVSGKAPAEWTTVTRDLWKDFGNSTITGIAPTAIGGAALFDRIELLPSVDR